MKISESWKRFPNRAVHLDFHTMPCIEDLGSCFDGERFAGTLKDAGVQYVNVFAKCNLGFAYYPTKAGIVYPGLKRDLLGEMVEACHKAGIGVSAYFNVGLSHEHARLHREWCIVNPEGQVYQFNKMDHWFRTMCFNSRYRDVILAMIDEVLEAYPVDGLLFDSMNMSPCMGCECVDWMRARGMDPLKPEDRARFAYDSSIAMKDAIMRCASRRRSDLFMYFLGLEAAEQPTHVDLEVLPQGGWGYDFLPSQIRYIRTLGKPYSTMTGRFQKSWGDLGGIRPEAALLHDCLSSVINAGKCSVGDHLHPRCQLEPAVYRMLKNVYGKIAALEEWTDGAEAEAEIAVLAPWLAGYHTDFAGGPDALRGFSRMLVELNQQFDVVDANAYLNKYTVIILPDVVTLDEKLSGKLKTFLEGGGRILSSGRSGLKPDSYDFALPQYADAITCRGPEPFNHTFVHPLAPLADGMPDIGTTIYDPGIEMLPRDAEPLAMLSRGYFNLGEWDGRHEYLYIPEKEPTGRPAVVRFARDSICHFSFPLGLSYFRHASWAHRTLFRNALRLLLPSPMLQLHNFPSYGQATITSRNSMYMLHLLCFVPEKRGAQMEIVEEPSVAVNVEARVHLKGLRPRSVYMAPQREPIPYTIEDGYVCFTVPLVRGYQMIVMD